MESGIYMCIYVHCEGEKERERENVTTQVKANRIWSDTSNNTCGNCTSTLSSSSSFKLLFSKLFEWTKLHGTYTQFCCIISFLVERGSKINYPGIKEEKVSRFVFYKYTFSTELCSFQRCNFVLHNSAIVRIKYALIIIYTIRVSSISVETYCAICATFDHIFGHFNIHYRSRYRPAHTHSLF